MVTSLVNPWCTVWSSAARTYTRADILNKQIQAAMRPLYLPTRSQSHGLYTLNFQFDKFVLYKVECRSRSICQFFLLQFPLLLLLLVCLDRALHSIVMFVVGRSHNQATKQMIQRANVCVSMRDTQKHQFHFWLKSSSSWFAAVATVVVFSSSPNVYLMLFAYSQFFMSFYA